MNGPGGGGTTSHEQRVFALLAGKWLSAAVSAAATLGLPDALAAGPKSLEVLARTLACEPNALARLVRVLVGEGLLRETIDRELELLPAGRLLCQDALGRLARYVGSPLAWDPWSDLVHAVRTGESAFDKRHGLPLFDYLDRHPEEASHYDAAIETFARAEAEALARSYDFSLARRVLDVGGGRGGLLVEVLGRFPQLGGALLERPTAARHATLAFEAAGIGARCQALVGDFFGVLPSGFDHVILKHIIHSWDDETVVALLARCAEALAGGEDGRILVVEGTLRRDGGRHLTNMLDLEMLVLCGPGRERTKPELRRLFARAGLRLLESRPLTESARLFVTAPKRSGTRVSRVRGRA